MNIDTSLKRNTRTKKGSRLPDCLHILISDAELVVQCLVDTAHHFGTGTQGFVAIILPFGRTTLVSLATEVEVGFELSHELVNVAAHVVEVHFAVHQHSLGIDNKGATQIQTIGRIVNTEQTGDIAIGIGSHGEGHIGQLFFFAFPCQMHKLCIGAHGYNLATHALEAVVLLCQSSKLGCSDKGEVCGVKEQDAPLTVFFLVGELEAAK